MLLLCSQRSLGSSAYISLNGNQSICSSDLKGSMVCLVWERKKFARQGWDLVPTYSQKEVEKVRAIVVPTYASGKQRDVSKRQTNVILMKNVSNLFHHIHFWKSDWLKSFIVSYRCFAWVYKRYHLRLRDVFVWKEFEMFLIVCDVIDEILLP